MNTESIPIPDLMKDLPMWKGLPIPYFTLIVDGVPDFTAVEFMRVNQCMMNETCGICGKPITDGKFCFIGGELSVKNRVYIDPASHVACAYYAAKACPYLAGTKRQYAKEGRAEKAEDIHILMSMKDQPRPKRMAIYIAKSYEMFFENGGYLCKAGLAWKIDWDAMPVSQVLR